MISCLNSIVDCCLYLVQVSVISLRVFLIHNKYSSFCNSFLMFEISFSRLFCSWIMVSSDESENSSSCCWILFVKWMISCLNSLVDCCLYLVQVSVISLWVFLSHNKCSSFCNSFLILEISFSRLICSWIMVSSDESENSSSCCWILFVKWMISCLNSIVDCCLYLVQVSVISLRVFLIHNKYSSFCNSFLMFEISFSRLFCSWIMVSSDESENSSSCCWILFVKWMISCLNSMVDCCLYLVQVSVISLRVFLIHNKYSVWLFEALSTLDFLPFSSSTE